MCTTKVSPTVATMSPLAPINMPELSMATCPRGSVSTAKISPAGAATARCTSSRSRMRRLSHPSKAAQAAAGRRGYGLDANQDFTGAYLDVRHYRAHASGGRRPHLANCAVYLLGLISPHAAQSRSFRIFRITATEYASGRFLGEAT